MKTWATHKIVKASPSDVLDALTDPATCVRWSPIDFELLDLDGERLETGSRAHLKGRLSGYPVHFEVNVLEAGDRGLALRAVGPIELDVEYVISVDDDGTRIEAAVSVRRRSGLVSMALARATNALLAAGALQAAIGRVAREVEPDAVPEAAAA